MSEDVRRARIAWERAKGKNNQEIADDMDITRQGVGYHTRKIQETAQDDNEYVDNLLTMARNLLDI